MPEQDTRRPLGVQISRMLADRGVKVVFGIPGVHNQELYRGLDQAGVTHVLARHEQGAGFMADGYARASGKPGVAYVISGPGVTNILTPLGQAYADSVPVLAISSCLDETAARRGQLHQMRDQEGAARTVCDWSETARTAEAAYALIDRALSEFHSARARPKSVTVPIRLLQSPADPAPAAALAPGLPQAGHDQIYQVVAAVLAAQKPLFIFGGGARGGAGAIPALLAQTGAAAFTTYAGRGLVPGDHPLNFGAYLPRPDSVAILEQADLVIAVGTELAEVDLWRDDLGGNARMIRIDIDPVVLATIQPGDMAVLGDAGAILRAMAIAIPARTNDLAPKWKAASVTAARARWRAETDAERPGIVPVCEALRAALPPGTMIYSDMTQFAYVAKEVWDMDRPGHWHHPTGFGTLGYALPAAIGGAVARPGLPTLAIAGDYGLQFTIQELATAVELGLPLPVILWDNGQLKEIADSMASAQIAPKAVVARNPDFALLAQAYGAHAAMPTTLAGLQKAVRAAFKADGPTLIRVTPAILET